MESSSFRQEPSRVWFLFLSVMLSYSKFSLGSGNNVVKYQRTESDGKKFLRCQALTENESSPLLLEDILPSSPKVYDKMTPPKQDGKATEVHFHVTVMSLDSIDESSMTFTADVFFAQTWKDHRLHFSENMSAEYRLLPLSWLHEIWRPDSYFKNAKRVTFQDMTVPNHYVWLYRDKSILYMTKLTLLLSCAMNFQRYPHDTQYCAMKIESLSHTTDDLVFTWESALPLAIDRIELPQLDLVSTTTGDCTQVYSTGNFTCLQLVFTLQRRLGYYLFHTYVPTCLIVIMSWISFWLRPEAVPARVTLGVTSLLTLSTQHANSQKSLPPVSYIKAIDIFMSSCTVFVFCSLMEYALVNVVLGDLVDGYALSHNQQGSVLTRSWRHVSRRLSRPRSRGTSRARSRCSVATISTEMETPLNGDGGNNEIGLTTVVSSPSVTIESKTEVGSALPDALPPAPAPVIRQPKHPELDKRRTNALMIDRVSRILFPVSFFILNVAYWCTFVFTEFPLPSGTSP